MPGATSLGLPYPLMNEPVNATSWQNLANAIDAQMTSLDAIRDLAKNRPFAVTTHQNTSVAITVFTTLTPWNAPAFDTGGYVQTTPGQFNVPPGIYYVTSNSFVSGTTTLTACQTTVATAAGATTWGGQTNEQTTGSLGAVAVGGAIVVCSAATTAIIVQGRWTGTGGPATFGPGQITIVQLRPFFDV